MTTDTERLRELFLDVAGDGTVTERQAEGSCHDPIEDADERVREAVWDVAREDGLEDAVRGAETDAGATSAAT